MVSCVLRLCIDSAASLLSYSFSVVGEALSVLDEQERSVRDSSSGSLFCTVGAISGLCRSSPLIAILCSQASLEDIEF